MTDPGIRSRGKQRPAGPSEARREGLARALTASWYEDGRPLPTLVELARSHGHTSAALEDAAFNELYRAHHAWIRHVCLKRLADPDDAEEAVQNTFTEAWRNIHKFEHRNGRPPQFRAWLTGVARFCVLRARRTLALRWRRLPTMSIEDIATRQDGEGVPITEGSMLFAHPVEGRPEAVSARLELTEVGRETASLTPNELRAIALTAAGHNLKEIAAAMGDPNGRTARRHVDAARAKLRDRMHRDAMKPSEACGGRPHADRDRRTNCQPSVSEREEVTHV